jgi:hypothetical protein
MNMVMNPTQTRASAGTLAKPAPGSIIFDKVSVVFETAELTAVSEFSLLGEHTVDVLREAGLGEQRIHQLVADNIVFQRPVVLQPPQAA